MQQVLLFVPEQTARLPEQVVWQIGQVISINHDTYLLLSIIAFRMLSTLNRLLLL